MSNESFTERLERENRETAERNEKLAVGIAEELGHGWQARPTRYSEHGFRDGFELRNELLGLRVFSRGVDQYLLRGKGRIELDGDTTLEVPSDYQRPHLRTRMPSATVTTTKGPAWIASNIVRRLLPDARKRDTELREALERASEHLAKLAAQERELRASGLKVEELRNHGGAKNDHVRRFRVDLPESWLMVELDGERVKFESFSTATGSALEILKQVAVDAEVRPQ